MTFNIIIQTHERKESVLSLVHSFSSYTHHELNFIVSDNGKQSWRELVDVSNVTIVDNGEHNSSRGHVLSIYAMNLSNAFIIHDDDEFDLDLFTCALDFIQINKVQVLVSPKEKIDKSWQPSSLLDVMEFYFLDSQGNCPLISGLYVSDMSLLHRFILPNYLMEGKYADVQIVGELLTSSNMAFVFNYPYVSYKEHDFNDNKVRNLKDRLALRKYLQTNSHLKGRVLGNLILFGYKGYSYYFIIGCFQSFFIRGYLKKIVLKIINK